MAEDQNANKRKRAIEIEENIKNCMDRIEFDNLAHTTYINELEKSYKIASNTLQQQRKKCEETQQAIALIDARISSHRRVVHCNQGTMKMFQLERLFYDDEAFRQHYETYLQQRFYTYPATFVSNSANMVNDPEALELFEMYLHLDYAEFCQLHQFVFKYHMDLRAQNVLGDAFEIHFLSNDVHKEKVFFADYMQFGRSIPQLMGTNGPTPNTNKYILWPHRTFLGTTFDKLIMLHLIHGRWQNLMSEARWLLFNERADAIRRKLTLLDLLL